MKAGDLNSHFVGGGVYGFFDATYIEANVGLLLGNANQDKLRDNASDDEKKEIDGSGTILLRYAFINATSEQRKSWGSAMHLKFNEDLSIKWTDGKDL
jgi:hypothetical protein